MALNLLNYFNDNKFFFPQFLYFFFINTSANATTNCHKYTEKFGKEYKIPNKLLTSISLVESGLKKEKNLFHGLGRLMFLESLSFLKAKMKQLVI